MRERWQRSAAPLRPEDAAVKNRLTSGELNKHLTARLRALEADGIPVETWPLAKVRRIYTSAKVAALQREARLVDGLEYSCPEFRRFG